MIRIITYKAEATGVTWFAVQNRKYTGYWSMSLIGALKAWFNGDRSLRVNNTGKKHD